MAYTFEDFTRAKNASGLAHQFSQYDINTARQHPSFGMSLVSAKQAWPTSNTQQQQQLRDSIEHQRMTLGGYSGGADGSQFLQNNPRQPQINNVLDQIGSFGSFDFGRDAPAYNNQYAAHQRQLLDKILNRPEFSYLKENDPQWASYAKQHRREGERATANALAQASRASGGRPSSFAVNAASQAGDYYASKLNDIIPQLYQQAYNRYLNEFQMKHQNLGAVNNLEQADFQRYLSELGQFNTDRGFAFNNWLTDYNMLNNNLAQLQGQEGTDYQRWLNNINMRTDNQRF
jgi:hypothetical protein